MIFVDLEKAFDCVWRRKIWDSLIRRRVEKQLIPVIKSLWAKNRSYVRTKHIRRI